jgi:hypothetical protein
MRRTSLFSGLAAAAVGLILGGVFGQAGSGRAADAGPLSTGTPMISGAAQEGQTLTSSNGSWTATPATYTYAWSQCDASGGSCAPIAGATAAAYKPASTDVGHTLRATVTATDSGGSGQATSAPSAVISGAAAPTNTAAPTITGSLQVGSTLTASKGTWSGSPTSFTYSWSRCGANGNSCATIDGATSDTYTLTQAAEGRTLRVSVVATNDAGSTPLATEFTTEQTAALPRFSGCPAGTGTVQVADLQPPARLMIDKASIMPRLVTRGTRTIQLHLLVTACNGRPVQGATVFATPIPYNQFAGPDGKTGADGTVTVTERRQHGFPARARHQHLLAVLVRATKPGDPVIGGVSTRRTVAFRVNLP